MPNRNEKNPSFKSSAGFIGAAGTIMQMIENKGYFASFLIQDGLGMTFPRIWTGFNRDKEVTGKFNKQEGLEVALREGITGPFIVAVAPIVLWATRKFCRSTNTNTNLIKRYGEALKEFVKDSKIDKAIKEDAAKFKKEFSRFNIERMYKLSVPKDTNPAENIDYIMQKFENLNSKDKDVAKQALTEIVTKINEKILETSPEYYTLNKISIGDEHVKKTFDARRALEALNDFCEDAITKNPDFKNIDETAAENIKNNFATKRLLTNIANIVLTLGGLSLIPKIYAQSDVAPGTQTMKLVEAQNKQDETIKDQSVSSEISFKGKGLNSGGAFSSIGKFLTKYVPEKFSDLFEYIGYNFSKTMFACLSLFGLLLPRGKKAYDRAQIDENGKRDWTEINEILLRDTVSSLSVVFAVPILTKVFVNAYESRLGFVLTNKASANKNPFHKFLDVINPYSQLEVLPLADLDAIYSNIDSKAKLLNFANFIDKNGGDLEKILSKSENAKEMFNENSFTLESIKSLSKKDKNAKIIDLFKKIESANPLEKNEVITKLMKGSGEIKANKIAQTVRGLNSLPGLIATFVISPVLLGVLIPKLTYFNTRKTLEKKRLESEQKATAQA